MEIGWGSCGTSVEKTAGWHLAEAVGSGRMACRSNVTEPRAARRGKPPERRQQVRVGRRTAASRDWQAARLASDDSNAPRPDAVPMPLWPVSLWAVRRSLAGPARCVDRTVGDVFRPARRTYPQLPSASVRVWQTGPRRPANGAGWAPPSLRLGQMGGDRRQGQSVVRTINQSHPRRAERWRPTKARSVGMGHQLTEPATFGSVECSDSALTIRGVLNRFGLDWVIP